MASSFERTGERNGNDDYYIPQIVDLRFAVYLIPAIIVIRMLFERFIASPIGTWLAIPDKRKQTARPIPVLENIYKTHGHLDKEMIKSLQQQTKMRAREIELWFKRRRNQDRPSKMKKLKESLWRLVAYSFLFSYGFYTIRTKTWFLDVEKIYRNRAKQYVPPDITLHYVLELSFYLSLLCSVFTDVRRKDNRQMLLHHLSVIYLLVFSWWNNVCRMGSLVAVLFDMSDVFLELTKSLIYSNGQAIVRIVSVVFVVVWCSTRLIIYPLLMVFSVRYAWKEEASNPTAYVLISNTIILFALNVYWTRLLFIFFISTLRNNDKQGFNDPRSSDEDESSHHD